MSGQFVTLFEWNFGSIGTAPPEYTLTSSDINITCPKHGLYTFNLRSNKDFNESLPLMRFQVNGLQVCTLNSALNTNDSTFICNEGDTIRIVNFIDQANTYALVRYYLFDPVLK